MLDVSMRRALPFFIVAAVAILSVFGGTMLYRAKRFASLNIPKDHSESVSAESIHFRGPSDAPVTLEEFADFQCRACGTLAAAIHELEREYHPRLRIVFHHFPLAGHKYARDAAIASEAAGRQDRFWEMHDLLYREQSVWSSSADVRGLFNTYAGMLGLDIDRFKKDMESATAKARVETDQQQGARLGVTSTPTIFLNNRALAPANLNLPGLRKAIEATLRGEPLP